MKHGAKIGLADHSIRDGYMYAALAMAICFWINSFLLKIVNFWLAMSIAAITLTVLSAMWVGRPYRKKDITARSVATGVISAVILYCIFWLGDILSTLMLPFAFAQVSSIYEIRGEAQAVIIALVLLFITSPGEEIFWRGFLQRWLMEKFGAYPGWIVAGCIYGAVHIFSGNFMLMMAALVAGLYWGYLYIREGNLVAVTISHALWTTGIFVLFPIMGR
jgi:membrane protease YdiL (CAAX protease family)